MSLTARFNVTERTLFQLLYDKVDDWLNPRIKS
jgi:HlyD family secretion protein